MIAIEVVYAEAGAADFVRLQMEAGTKLRAAITASGMLDRHSDIELERAGFGVFGRLRGLDESLSDGDRVEIYRRLSADPKQARRQRVRLARRKTR